MFSQASVILSTGEWGVHPHADTPWADTPPPPGQTTPQGRHPKADTRQTADGTHPTGMHIC